MLDGYFIATFLYFHLFYLVNWGTVEMRLLTHLFCVYCYINTAIIQGDPKIQACMYSSEVYQKLAIEAIDWKDKLMMGDYTPDWFAHNFKGRKFPFLSLLPLSLSLFSLSPSLSLSLSLILLPLFFFNPFLR